MSKAHWSIASVVGEPHAGRFASLEGYRAVAALSVVVFHVRGRLLVDTDTGQMDVIDNLGNFGVAMFFLLSGFLLYLPVSRRLFARASQPPTAQFLLRRFVRIFPAYWLAIIGFALTAPSIHRQSVTPWKVFLLFDGGLRFLGVSWTLVIELWFYFLIAALALVLPRVLRRCRTVSSVGRAQLIMLLVMALVAQCWRISVTGNAIDLVRYVNWLPSFLDWFAWGMLMAVLVAWIEHGGTLPKALKGLADHGWVCVALGALCYAMVMWVVRVPPSLTFSETRVATLFRFTMQPIAAFLLLLPATLGRPQHVLQRALRRPLIAAFGTVSYGLYLWHISVLGVVERNPIGSGGAWWMIVNLLVVVAVSFVLSTLSYRLVERPALLMVPSAFERLARPEPSGQLARRVGETAPR